MRLTALSPEADGTVEALLEVEPKPGWITYWREPGASGIPPQVNLAGGATLVSMSYPVPKVLTLGDLTDIGYDAPVAFPLTLKKTAGELKLDAFIGICNEICIPFQASFSLPVDAGSDPAEAARIEAAKATLPAAPSSAFAVKAVRQSGEALSLSLTLPSPSEDAEAILTGPEGTVFTASGKGPDITVPIPGLPKGSDARTYDWHLILKNGGRAIETGIRLE